MSPLPLRTLLIGLGRIAAGYADDPVTARHFPFATHAQVLAAHPAFLWDAALDPDPQARDRARSRWPGPRYATSLDELDGYAPDVVVLATPPHDRPDVLDRFRSLRGVIVEKPVGTDLEDASRFVAKARERGVTVQVNLWRRADATCRALAAGELRERIGSPQVAFGLYGGGIRNNGTHLIDLLRLLLGEVDMVRCTAPRPSAGRVDPDIGFSVTAGGVPVHVGTLDFAHYREIGLDVWGTDGRLELRQEGLELRTWGRGPHRALSASHEVASEVVTVSVRSPGQAMYELYGNLARSLEGAEELWSPGVSAVRTTAVVDEVLRAASAGEP